MDSWRYVLLELGRVYHHQNGQDYKCMAIEDGGFTLLQRTSDKWTLRAYNVQMNNRGKICWAYSKNGHWEDAT